MNDDLAEILEKLQSEGYDSLSPHEDRHQPEAGGNILLPEEYQQEPRTGWKQFLPRIYDGGDPDLVPDEVRSVVENHGWTVQPMGRDDDTVYVIISEGGV